MKIKEEMLNAKPNRIQPNAVPCAFLILAIILSNIEMSKGQLKCNESKDIKWKSKKTNKVIGCTPCQPCPSSQEYSIPCGSTVYIGTPAKCVSCPVGKYSDGFNTKPCVSCILCSDRIVKQNCTLSRNSICGKCKPGYYSDSISFGCIKCAKCCHDGQDEIPASCTAANQCKSRPYGCPTSYRFNVPTVSSGFTSKASSSLVNHTTLSASFTADPDMKKPSFISQEPNILSNKSSGQSVSGIINALSTVNKKKHHDESTTGAIILIVLIILIITVHIIVTAVVFFKKGNKQKKSDKIINANKKDVENSIEYKAVSQIESPAHYDTSPMENDQTLEEFIQQNYTVVDKLSKVLNKKKEGIWDFERVAMEWKIKKDMVNCIRNEIHVEGGSPLRKLLDILCSQRLCMTVKQLANSVKSINSDAFEILKPHF